jgi:putative ABC transport system permease protein
MHLGLVLRQLLADLRRQKLRTALTVLGITWGTTAVVALLAFGVGLERQMIINARGLGDGLVLVSGGRTTRPFAGFPERRQIRLVEADADLIGREIDGLDVVTPEYGTWGRHIRRGDTRTEVYLTGVRADYGELRNVFAQAGGRFISERDVAGQRRVVVLGDEVKRLLFGEAEAVGEEVFIGRTPFTVVGIMAPKTQNSSYAARDQDRAFIPISTYVVTEGGRHVNNILFRPIDAERSEAAAAEVRAVLGRQYAFDPGDRAALNIWDTNEMMKVFAYIFIGFNAFLAIVGSFTLVVGGVGVANIMFVVVQERTREIGLRRSLGARRRDVLGQIMLEALLIVSVGAGLGLSIAFGLTRLVGMLPIEEYVGVPTISPSVLLATAGLLGVVALAAGLMPARRAARLDPAEALRWNA